MSGSRSNSRAAKTTAGEKHLDRRWLAVAERDRAADGTFVYAVTTTGIYCRPSCPSKRPKRANVVYFDTPRAAAAAGFRDCKRCNPIDPESDVVWRSRIEVACRMIENAQEPLALAALATAARMSPYHFHRRFKQLTGLTPKGYASAVRTSRLRRTLRGATSVTTAAYDAGFASSTRFYAGAKKALGMQPARYKKGGAGTTLRVATSPSPLGVVLVAATEIGVAAIFLGDDRKSLDEALQARFPKAEKIAADKELAKTLARVVSLIEHPASSDLPLDIRGTAFEHKVWTALQEIPIGTTASYAEVAKRIGAPKAVRAVARACAANSIAIAVPCHRVVGSDGNLTGYRWGIERKRQLLASEARIAARRTPAPRKRKG